MPPQVLQLCSGNSPFFAQATSLVSQSLQLMWLEECRVTMPLSPGAVLTEGDLNVTVWHLLQVTALVGQQLACLAVVAWQETRAKALTAMSPVMMDLMSLVFMMWLS